MRTFLIAVGVALVVGAPTWSNLSAAKRGRAASALHHANAACLAADAGGKALDGFPHGRHEPRGARAGRGRGRLEQPVLVELLGPMPALGDPFGVEQQRVPGGQDVLRAVQRAGKRIVGIDLCEVAPGETEWDANVGARLLYKMIGFALLTQ